MTRNSEPAPTVQELAVERTRLALERTMMGWIRTTVAMISFGFSIFTFFQSMRRISGLPPRTGFFSSRGLALMLVGSSTLLLVLATIQYRLTWRRMLAFGAARYADTILIGAVLVALIGLVTFIGIALAPVS
jgi:putative membrane protein